MITIIWPHLTYLKENICPTQRVITPPLRTIPAILIYSIWNSPRAIITAVTPRTRKITNQIILPDQQEHNTSFVINDCSAVSSKNLVINRYSGTATADCQHAKIFSPPKAVPAQVITVISISSCRVNPVFNRGRDLYSNLWSYPCDQRPQSPSVQQARVQRGLLSSSTRVFQS